MSARQWFLLKLQFSLKSHPHDSGYLFNQKDKYFLEDEVSLGTVSSCSDILY